MKMQDSFLNKLQPLENFTKLFEKKERFGTYNEHTLGFLLVGIYLTLGIFMSQGIGI